MYVSSCSAFHAKKIRIIVSRKPPQADCADRKLGIKGRFVPQERGVPRAYSPGNGNLIIFFDTTYKGFTVGYGVESENNYSDSGTYYIKDLPNSYPQIVFNGDSLPARDLFLIDKDTLTLFVGDVASDGNILVYQKIN